MKKVKPLSGALACLLLTLACGGPDLPQRPDSSRLGADQRAPEDLDSANAPTARTAGDQTEQSGTAETVDQAGENPASEEVGSVFYGPSGAPVDLPALTVSLLHGLESDLAGEATSGVSSGAALQLTSAAPLLPAQQIRIVLQAAVDLLVELGLDQSEDVVAVVPVLLKGALSALDSISPEAPLDFARVASALTQSILSRSGGLSEALRLAAQLRGVSADAALDELVRAVTRAALPALVGLPIDPARLPGAIEELTRGLVGSIVGRIASGSGAGTPSGEIRILPVSEVSQLLDSVIDAAFGSLGQVRFPGPAGSMSTPLDLSRLKEIVLAVVHGGARGLGELDGALAGAGGIKPGDLPALARAVASRALQSAVNFARTQWGSSAGAARDQMAALAESIAQGLISGLDRLKVPGFNAALLQETVDAVISALVAALKDLDIENLTEQEIEEFATSVASGTTGALAGLDLRSFFTLTREDLIKVGAAAAARAVADLPLKGKDETLVGRLMAAVTTGASQGITDWGQGSLEGDLLGSLLKSVTAGVTEAVGDVQIGGRNLDDLAGMTLTVVEAAGRVAGQLQNPETQKSVVQNILDGIVAGAVESLEETGGAGGAAASLQDYLGNIEGGLGGLIGGLFGK